MASHYEAPIRKPLVTGNKSYHDVTIDVAAPVEGKANTQWWIVFGIALSAFLWGVGCIIYTISTGIGTWGLNKTVGWAWDITNFVWWVGIGHAGTLISAVLLLFRQKWRMAINRSAEAMTIFSVIQAGLFPIIHMGPPLVSLLGFTDSEFFWITLGKLQLSFIVGCICNFNISFCIISILVDRITS